MLNLDEVLSANRARYLEHFKELVARDTHCLGHGIEGGLEKAGQDLPDRSVQTDARH